MEKQNVQPQTCPDCGEKLSEIEIQLCECWSCQLLKATRSDNEKKQGCSHQAKPLIGKKDHDKLQ
ncbi:MAG: hypothetical protein IT249_19990 [Chitinophagaceae bacterium]|nr:hypothetical protein [Chitinophagaceae bacterium]